MLKLYLARTSHEIALIVCGLLAIYLLLSLLSYNAADPSWSYSESFERIANHGGLVGAWSANFLLHFFGVIAYTFPFIIGYSGWILYRLDISDANSTFSDSLLIRLCGIFLAIIASCGVVALYLELASPLIKGVSAGGIIGELMTMHLRVIIGDIGSTLAYLGMLLIGVMLLTWQPWSSLVASAKCVLLSLCSTLYKYAVRTLGIASRMLRTFPPSHKTTTLQSPAESKREPIVDFSKTPKNKMAGHSIRFDDDLPRFANVNLVNAPEIPAASLALPDVTAIDPQGNSDPALVVDNKAFTALPSSDIGSQTASPLVAKIPFLPPLSLLDTPPVKHDDVSHVVLETVANDIHEKLGEFGIEVNVVGIHPGPVVTRYELQLAPGVKVNRITSIGKDLARSLSTRSVRIEEIIPGKTTIGLELPNEKRELVMLSELLASPTYQDTQSPLTLGLGKSVSGQPIVANLAAMPHLLVAGTTGSGKSVAINAMILSLLYKTQPEEIKMLMIDPKMLELSAYDGIAHLLAPVVTDMKQAANALRWCVAEMERRYKLMSALGVRNISGYNTTVLQAAAQGMPLCAPPALLSDKICEDELEKLPFIVVVIDEFADMMMTTGKKTEEYIVRLAQKARAAGIHLLLATQRPSVNVITGLIKANIPSRIAFQVSSKVDSRTILDQGGAENLLGHGDMLFLGPGTTALQRVHGAFVADHEVHQVVNHLKQTSTPTYLAGILDGTSVIDSSKRESYAIDDEDYDECYDEALYIVTETRKASISLVQRRLKIGYNRAARLLEKMEAEQVIGPLATNGSREVLAPPPPRTSDDD